jgi:flagellar biosynthesis protein FlhB
VPLFLVGLLVGYGQVGFQVAPKAVRLDPSRLSPVKGFGRIFSARSAMRTLSALLKVVLIGAAMSTVVWSSISEVSTMVGNDLGPSLVATGTIVLRAAVAALIVVFALGLFDLVFQRSQHDKDLRMSRKELKEEHRNSEGDPHLRARIRQVQRELASRRMTTDVPNATVVVTNPTHYAVALRYEPDGAPGAAPVVVAKGVDHVARRIKEVAREHGVICFEDVPLARALHAQAEIGQEIPQDLYAAVASVLAYVYRVRGAGAAAAAGT